MARWGAPLSRDAPIEHTEPRPARNGPGSVCWASRELPPLALVALVLLDLVALGTAVDHVGAVAVLGVEPVPAGPAVKLVRLRAVRVGRAPGSRRVDQAVIAIATAEGVATAEAVDQIVTVQGADDVIIRGSGQGLAIVRPDDRAVRSCLRKLVDPGAGQVHVLERVARRIGELQDRIADLCCRSIEADFKLGSLARPYGYAGGEVPRQKKSGDGVSYLRQQVEVSGIRTRDGGGSATDLHVRRSGVRDGDGPGLGVGAHLHGTEANLGRLDSDGAI